MNKKVLMSTIALLALFTMIILPVKAVTKEDYWAYHEMELIDPGKQWVSEEGILQIQDSYWMGTNEGSLGVGTLEIWFEHMRIDPATGEGTFGGKFLATINDRGTLAGNGRGQITGGVFSSGIFVATHGTGEFEGVKVMGSFEGVMTDPTHMVMDCLGITMYP